MKTPLCTFVAVFLLLFTLSTPAGTFYVDANSANPTPPYSDWSTAATNIQDAIDAATDGDQIWVTNGVYASGGRVMAGDLTNRVALNKAVTVQSVNGPFVTVIQGAGLSNGTAAIRCAWLTNNAALIGFTLTRGATRTSGDLYMLESGGGAWCASSNALLQNCVIVSNAAVDYGAGAYLGTVNNCLVSSNGLQSFNSGGGALYNSSMNNCTVVSNTCIGTAQCRATNSIVYYNYTAGNNYAGGSLSYCCTTPKPSGTGNFTNAPQLFPDGIHLSANSPCVGAGTTPATAADIFGNPWANPSALGCAEVAGPPLVSQPQLQLTSSPVGFTMGSAAISGTGPFTFNWLKNGVALADNGHFSSTQSTNLIAIGVNFSDAGGYQLVVSNAFGAVTSAVVQVVIHCVNAAGSNPAPPYTNWDTAATNIQDAISAAASGEIVLVTNGAYATGGKSMDNVITNRVSIDNPILVQSVNGPGTTMIQGAWDPNTTNGPAAIRCVWMTNKSILNGFTISGGATRVTTGSVNPSMNGGGIWGASNNTVVANCVIIDNCASYLGGGAYACTLNNCTIVENNAMGSGTAGFGVANAGSGGGAANCILNNCFVISNSARQSNGGGTLNCSATNTAFVGNRAPLWGSAAYQGKLMNCTVVNNTAGGYGSYGGAAANATLVNSIVYGNFNIGPGVTNYYSCTFNNCDSDPLPAGTGNVDIDPQLLADNIHLAQTSPCIGIGTAAGLSGTDIDGQAWNNPPAIGCDEWQPLPAMTLAPAIQVGTPARRALSFTAVAAGQTPLNYFWLKDRTLLQDDGHHANSATANLIVNNFGPDDAGAYQLVASNSFGMATSQVAQVVIHAVDAGSASPIAPYSSWATAASTIQDAIDAANPGDIVLVTDGVYANGGRVMVTDLTNRVALNKALTVISVNGYSATVIQGQWDPVSTNGPAAIRCAWVGTGATLNGFTLRNGATRGGSLITTDLQYGGGAWLADRSAVVSDCALTNNSARYKGGGVAFGTVNNCFLTYNSSQYGGGAYSTSLNNCTLMENHCFTTASGGGVDSCVSRNCIIIANYYSALGAADYQLLNYYSGSIDTFTNCVTSPVPFHGAVNMDVNPLFLDRAFHLAPASPCRGAGNPLYAFGNDLDDEPFGNPPSIGCDEVVATNMNGPLSVGFVSPWTEILVNHRVSFLGQINGRPSELDWSFGDGPVVTNFGCVGSHTWTNSGTYTVTLTAYNSDYPSGVSSNFVVTVNPLLSPSLQPTTGMVSNSFQFSFPGQTRAWYTIQYASNLVAPVSWQILQMVFPTNDGVITIQDPAVTNGNTRFYRVQAQ